MYRVYIQETADAPMHVFDYEKMNLVNRLLDNYRTHETVSVLIFKLDRQEKWGTLCGINGDQIFNFLMNNAPFTYHEKRCRRCKCIIAQDRVYCDDCIGGTFAFAA